MGKALSIKLSCMWTGHVLIAKKQSPKNSSSNGKKKPTTKWAEIYFKQYLSIVSNLNQALTLLLSERPKLYGVLAILSAKGLRWPSAVVQIYV